jgi:GNAT superfamily N-acetyltransferase
VVAADGAGGVFGFASFGPARRGQAGACGEVYTLYLLAAQQGRGSGRRLLAAAAQRLQAAGFSSLAVWVLSDNLACAFYERLGGVAAERRSITLGGAELHETCYLWPELGPLTGRLLAAGEAP